MFCDIVDSTRLAATLELESLQQTVEFYQKGRNVRRPI